MAEKDLLTPETEEQLARLGAADLVVGVTALAWQDGAERMVPLAQEGLRQAFPDRPTAVIQVHADGGDWGASDSASAVPVFRLSGRVVPPPSGPTPAERWPSMAVRTVFEAARRVKAKGVALLDAEVLSTTPDWVGRLLEPVVRREMDLAAPYYVRHPFNGAVTSGIVYPLTRALYGRRLRFPLGGDFACSTRLIEHCLGRDIWNPRAGSLGVELRLVTTAVEGGFRICQARLGSRTVATADQAALSTILTEALSLVFVEMERSTAVWQKVRNSLPVDVVGSDPGTAIEPVAVELKRLLDPFRLGQQNLRDVWGLILPPSSLVELKRLAKEADPDFRLPDRLWARIVYDFSLAFRLRVMSRDHLMGALAPLYLGWFGSLAAEMDGADPARLEGRLEQLCLTFEAEKPYLISRWRWPDRFNP